MGESPERNVGIIAMCAEKGRVGAVTPAVGHSMVKFFLCALSAISVFFFLAI